MVAVETAYERNLEAMRVESETLMNVIKADVKHKQQVIAHTVKAKEEVCVM